MAKHVTASSPEGKCPCGNGLKLTVVSLGTKTEFQAVHCESLPYRVVRSRVLSLRSPKIGRHTLRY